MILALLAILGGVGTGVLAARQPPSYRSEVQLLVTFVREPGQPASTDGDRGSLMQRRVKSYASMMNSPRLTRPVIDTLDLSETPEELADRIVASSALDTLAIRVAVTYGDAERAAAIANALADELQRIADRDAAPAGLTARARVSVLSAAAVPQRPEPVSWPLHAAAGAVGGSAIGIGAALLLAYRRDGTPVSADLKAVWAAANRAMSAPLRRPAEQAGPPAPSGTAVAEGPHHRRH